VGTGAHEEVSMVAISLKIQKENQKGQTILTEETTVK